MLVIGLAAACGSQATTQTPPPDPRPTYSGCRSAADCVGGDAICLLERYGLGTICSRPCTSDAQCGDGSCVAIDDVSRVCTPSCINGTDYQFHEGNWACIDGKQIPCVANPCPAPTLCVHGRACGQPFGGPCARDEECASNNCSKTRGTCLVGVGDACTPDTCDLCMTIAGLGDWTFCTKGCSYKYDCPEWLCETPSHYSVELVGGGGRCVPGCFDGCPQCSNLHFANNTSRAYCYSALVPVMTTAP